MLKNFPAGLTASSEHVPTDGVAQQTRRHAANVEFTIGRGPRYPNL